jgi:microcystin-dependent protein
LLQKELPNVIGDITMHSGGTATNISNTSGCFSAQITNTNKYRDGGTTGTTANSIGIVHFDNGGKNIAHNNMPPYLTVYM